MHSLRAPIDFADGNPKGLLPSILLMVHDEEPHPSNLQSNAALRISMIRPADKIPNRTPRIDFAKRGLSIWPT
jgi:hypothetical protein